MQRIRHLKLMLASIWHLPTFLSVALLLLVVLIFARDPFDLEVGNGEEVEARITSLSSAGSGKYQGRWPGLRVWARSEDGATGVTTALPSDLKGCKVGDAIKARQAGFRLYLSPQPCDQPSHTTPS